MFRALKTLALLVGGVLSVLLVLGSLIGAAGLFAMRSCADRLHECYVATDHPNDLTRTRLGALSQFTASAQRIAFPVALSGEETGILVFDRDSGHAKIIHQHGFEFWSPGFSLDGERLLLIRRETGTSRRQILSCLVSSWLCAVVLTSAENLRSPVEVGNGAIVYSASPVHTRDNRAYYTDWDLYYLRLGSDPVRMSDFKLWELHSIAIVKDQIIFSASGPKPNNPVIPKSNPLSHNWSEIYSVELNPNALQITKPSGVLSPLFLIGGYSYSVSVSPDGRWAAIHNTEEGRFKYRFDLVLAKQDGSVDRRIILTGLGFSPGAFVGDTLVFNEMFEDRYDLRLFDLTAGSFRTIAAIDHAPQKLRALQHIDLKIAGEQYAVRTMK